MPYLRRPTLSIPHPPLERSLCFIDVETTGPEFGFHEIIDVAAIRTPPDGRHEVGRWSRRVLPGFPERITDRAREVNGFDPSLWRGSVESTADLWSSFARFVDGCMPVCHNPSFDRSFITLAARATGVLDLGLDYHWIGTESLAWPLVRRGLMPVFSLEGISSRLLGYSEPIPHTALAGAETCRAVYLALMRLLETVAGFEVEPSDAGPG